MNYLAGTIMFLAGFCIAIGVILGGIAMDKFLWEKPYRRIDLRVLALVTIGTIPMGLTLASWDIFQSLDDHFLYARALWGITLLVSSVIYLYISLMSPFFYLKGRFKDSWLDFWFQLTDPASWGGFPFPYGRRLRTLKQSAKTGHFSLAELPFIMKINRLLRIEPDPENKE